MNDAIKCLPVANESEVHVEANKYPENVYSYISHVILI